MIRTDVQLKSLIDRLWDKLWSGGISNPLSAIEQITYLLFIKQLDEMDKREERQEIVKNRKEPSIFKGNEKLRWSYFKTLPAGQMLEHIQTKVFPFIKKIDGKKSPFARYMENAVFIIQKPSLLVEAVKIIDEIYERLNTEYYKEGRFIDAQGDVYEYLLDELKSSGKNGQFRTPPHIIQMVVEMVLGEMKDKEFLNVKFNAADPATGTAGFLLAVYKHIITRFSSKTTTDANGFKVGMMGDKLPSEWHEKLERDILFGYDIDVTMVRIALMNLVMHGIGSPQINFSDTLSKNFEENNKYKTIFANPPFTGSIDRGDVHEDLRQLVDTTKSELLFLARIYMMLQKGGSAGVIVPQGVLFGAGKAFVAVRKLLMERCELKAVVTMPSGVFKPYAGVATAVLLFTKVYNNTDTVTEVPTKQVWFYEMRSDGYTLDDKRNKLADHGDLHTIVNSYHYRFEKDDPNRIHPSMVDFSMQDEDIPRDTIFTTANRERQLFFVSAKEIIENDYDLSLSKYKQEVYEKVKYETPKAILEKLMGKDGNAGIEKEIMTGLKELKEMLK